MRFDNQIGTNIFSITDTCLGGHYAKPSNRNVKSCCGRNLPLTGIFSLSSLIRMGQKYCCHTLYLLLSVAPHCSQLHHALHFILGQSPFWPQPRPEKWGIFFLGQRNYEPIWPRPRPVNGFYNAYLHIYNLSPADGPYRSRPVKIDEPSGQPISPRGAC